VISIYFLLFLGFELYSFYEYKVIVNNGFIDLILLISSISLFMICFIIAKGIKEVEIDREAKFEDFFLYLICIALSPMGVWFIQPKLNKMVNDTNMVS
jgi:hypothetical protein